MSLYPCSVCGKPIDFDVTRCLHCGAPGKTHAVKYIGSAIVGLGCVMFVCVAAVIAFSLVSLRL